MKKRAVVMYRDGMAQIQPFSLETEPYLSIFVLTKGIVPPDLETEEKYIEFANASTEARAFKFLKERPHYLLYAEVSEPKPGYLDINMVEEEDDTTDSA